MLACDCARPQPPDRFDVRQDKKLTYPVGFDPRHEVARQFGITGLPATLLVGPDGSVRGVSYGPKEWDGREARALIASLLPRAPSGAAR